MQVAAEAVQNYPDGIWLVELAGLSAYSEVPSATALALKIPLAADQSIPAQVFSFLKEKRCLIVFDNFEHVVDVTRNSEFGKRRIGFGPLATKDFDERAVPILAKVLGNDARKQINHNSR